MADLDDVIAEHGPAIACVAGLYARSPADRDDLLQDIMVALLRALPIFREECSLRTYVLRIAHVQGMRRAWKREKLVFTDDLDERADAAKGDEEVAILKRFDHERLMAAIKELPLGLKETIALALEGLTSREIGEILGLWERARGHLLQKASRSLSSARMGPARLRWVGEWIEWRTLDRSEAAGFALRGADARRWFGLRLRLAALSKMSVSDAIQPPDQVSRLERARADAASEFARLDEAARARSVGPSRMSLDGCPEASLEPIDNIAWLALLDTPESPWDDAAW